MGKEILNRRQNIYAEDIPPEIVDTSGFITATNYATASTGGVVKVGTTGGLQVSSGTLKGKTLADAEAYASAGNDTVMTKGDMAFVSTGGAGCEVLYTPTGTPAELGRDTSHLFTLADVDFTEYNIVVVNIIGGGDHDCNTAVIMCGKVTGNNYSGYFTNTNGNTTQYIQLKFAQSVSEGDYDSFYATNVTSSTGSLYIGYVFGFK